MRQKSSKVNVRRRMVGWRYYQLVCGEGRRTRPEGPKGYNKDGMLKTEGSFRERGLGEKARRKGWRRAYGVM